MRKINTCIYIDGANLYRGTKSSDFDLDYQRFFRYLKDKFHPESITLFLGYILEKEPLYTFLRSCGYHLVFKETLVGKEGEIKGNCDGELIVNALEDFYEKVYNQGILVSGDGDFSCLIDFWKRKNCKIHILVPQKKYSSYLLRKRNVPTTYLDHPDISRLIRKDPR